MELVLNGFPVFLLVQVSFSFYAGNLQDTSAKIYPSIVLDCKYTLLFGCEMSPSEGLQPWTEPLILTAAWININEMPYLINAIQTCAYTDRHALAFLIMALF